MGTINLNAPVSPLVGRVPSPSRVNAPSSIRGQAGMKLFGGSLSNSLAGDLEGLSQSINALHKLMQTAQTVSGGTLTDLTSTGGVTPDIRTLVIADGLLTISGTGTMAGHGDITIDGLLSAGALTVSGASSLAELTVSGATTLDGDIGGTHGQNVGTGDSPTFSGLTTGALAVFNGPVRFFGHLGGTHGQDIGRGDGPIFANLTVEGPVAALSLAVTGDLRVDGHPTGPHLQDLGAADAPIFAQIATTGSAVNDLGAGPLIALSYRVNNGGIGGTQVIDNGGNASFVTLTTRANGEITVGGRAAAPTAPVAGFAALYYDTVIGALRYNLAGAGWVSITPAAVGGLNTQVLFNDGGVESGDASLTWATGPKILSALFVSTSGLTVTTTGIDVTGGAVFHTGMTVAGVAVLQNTPKFAGTNTTGAGAALLGANCPAVTPGAPNTWIQVTTAAGATAYIPAWV